MYTGSTLTSIYEILGDIVSPITIFLIGKEQCYAQGFLARVVCGCRARGTQRVREQCARRLGGAGNQGWLVEPDRQLLGSQHEFREGAGWR